MNAVPKNCHLTLQHPQKYANCIHPWQAWIHGGCWGGAHPPNKIWGGAWGVQIVKFLQFQVENWKKHYNFKVKIAKTTAILR